MSAQPAHAPGDAERRESARKAALSLPRALIFAAIVEIIAATLRPIFEPAATPVVLSDIAAVARFVAALLAALALSRALSLAKTLSLGPLATLATVAFAFTALVPPLRFFDVVPANITEPLWDSALTATYGALFSLATVATLWLGRAMALSLRHRLSAKRFGVAIAITIFIAPIGLAAVDPTFSPHPIIAPALALLAPWTLVLGGPARILRWDHALWITLFLLTAGRLVTLPDTALALPGLALASTALLAAFAATGPLHELSDHLSGREVDGPSATFLRRLVAGTLGGAASARIGDLPLSSQLPSESNAEESLALAYRELGIEPAKPTRPPENTPPATATDATPASLPPLLATVTPFVPKSRQGSRPTDAPSETGPASADSTTRSAPNASPLPGPVDWSPTRRCFHLAFRSTLALTLLIAFGALLLNTPLGGSPVMLALFDLALIAGLAPLLPGLLGARRAPPPEPPSHARTLSLALALAASATALFLVSAASHLLFPTATPLRFIAAIALLATLATLLVALAQLAAPLDEPRLRHRARTSILLIAALTVLLVVRHAVLGFDASDLQWLAWPLGLGVVGVFVGLAIGLLWLFKDAQDATLRFDPTTTHREVP